MSHKALVLSAAGVAAGAAAEELILRVPRGFTEATWDRIVARNATRAMTIIEIWARVSAMEYCLVGGATSVAGETVVVRDPVVLPDDVALVAKFTTTTAGDVLGLWAFGRERDAIVEE